MLNEKDACLNSLPKSPNEPLIVTKLPLTIWVQLDNYAKDNKNIFVCLLVFVDCERHLKEVFVYFLLVGQTHDDIETSFGW